MTLATPPRLLFVCGLRREAVIARSAGWSAICGDGERLRQLLAEVVATPELTISFGICGGLDPALRPGDIVVGMRVVADGAAFAADERIAGELARRLGAAGERVTLGGVAAVEAPALTSAAKAELRRATGASAVDMESHLAARFAADRGAPFAIVRAVGDPAGRKLPPLVAKAVKSDGSIDLGAVVAGLFASPTQALGLVAAARDSAAAFATLRRCRRLPGLFLGLGGAQF